MVEVFTLLCYNYIDKSESDIQQSLDILELLKNTLMQKYFG